MSKLCVWIRYLYWALLSVIVAISAIVYTLTRIAFGTPRFVIVVLKAALISVYESAARVLKDRPADRSTRHE